MGDLIKTEQDGQFPIDARELHEFLESKQDFSNWVKSKVVNNLFFEIGVDYVLLNNIVEQTGRGGHNRIDYGLTINTAKKISMAEQTAKGNQARKYFIECEVKSKAISAQPQIPDFTNPAIAARAWADEVDKKLIAEKIIIDQKPRMDVLNRISTSDGLLGLMETAKHLQVRYVDLKKLVLLPDRWIYRRGGSKHWLGYQDKVNQGLLEHKVTTVDVGGNEKIYQQVKVTPKGLLRLAWLLDNSSDGCSG